MSHILLPSQKPMVPYVLVTKQDMDFRVKVSAFIFVPTGMIAKKDAHQHIKGLGNSRQQEFMSLDEDTMLFLGEWLMTDMRVDEYAYADFSEKIIESTVMRLFDDLGSRELQHSVCVKIPYLPDYISPLEAIHAKLPIPGEPDTRAGSGTHSAVHDDSESASPDYPTTGKRPW